MGDYKYTTGQTRNSISAISNFVGCAVCAVMPEKASMDDLCKTGDPILDEAFGKAGSADRGNFTQDQVRKLVREVCNQVLKILGPE